MKKLIYILFAGVIMLFTACEDDYDKLVKEPNDITLNELQLENLLMSSRMAVSNPEG